MLPEYDYHMQIALGEVPQNRCKCFFSRVCQDLYRDKPKGRRKMGIICADSESFSFFLKNEQLFHIAKRKKSSDYSPKLIPKTSLNRLTLFPTFAYLPTELNSCIFMSSLNNSELTESLSQVLWSVLTTFAKNLLFLLSKVSLFATWCSFLLI